MKTQKRLSTFGLILALTLHVNAQNAPQGMITTAVCPAPEGGYVYAGITTERGHSDYRVVKMDADNLIQWDYSFGGDGHDEPTAITCTSDDGFILGGRSSSGISGNKTAYSHGAFDIWLVKVDGKGVLQWERTINGSDQDNLVSIVELDWGGFLLAAYSNSGRNITDGMDSDYMLIWTNSMGKVIQERRYGSRNNDILTSVGTLQDGSIVMAGFSPNKNGNTHRIICTDRMGKTTWRKQFETSRNDYLVSVKETVKGSMVLNSNTESCCFYLDRNGNEVPASLLSSVPAVNRK
ncbi:MAG: hypothetical protein GY790_21360 [Bacteroidetes bacterium]|nr:hypothetical protein [Bacteroidota bacterium]